MRALWQAIWRLDVDLWLDHGPYNAGKEAAELALLLEMYTGKK